MQLRENTFEGRTNNEANLRGVAGSARAWHPPSEPSGRSSRRKVR